MSIVSTLDINKLIFDYLSTKDVKNMSHVNKYYWNFTRRKYLKEFYDFFNIHVHSIKFEYTDYTESHAVLFKSIIYGNIQICDYLINIGYDINIDEEFSFRLACKYQNTSFLEYIYPKVKNIFASKNYQDALCFTMFNDNPLNCSNVDFIIDKYGVDFIFSDQYCKYFFLVISMTCDIYHMQHLCKYISVEKFNEKNIFSIVCACENLKIAKFLFDKYSPSITYDCFSHACLNDRVGTFLWLYENHKNFDFSQDDYGLYKISLNSISCLEQLFKINRNVPEPIIMYLCITAIDLNKLNIFMYLITKIMDFDNCQNYFNKFIKRSVELKHYDIANFLVKKMQSIITYNVFTVDPLFENAYINYDHHILKLLIKHTTKLQKCICNYGISNDILNIIFENIEPSIDLKNTLTIKIFNEPFNCVENFLSKVTDIDMSNISLSNMCKFYKKYPSLAHKLCDYDKNFRIIIDNDTKIVQYIIEKNIE